MIKLLRLVALPLAVLLALTSAAHADVVAQTVSGNPIESLVPTASSAWDVLSTSGPYWAAALVAYLLLSTFLSKQHWLAQGRLLSGLTGASMVMTAVVQWHWAGAPAAGIATAALLAFNLVLHPTVSVAKPSTAGVAAVLSVLLLGGMVAGEAACATVRSKGGAALSAAVDCETAELKPLVAELLPLATQYVLSIVSSDGRSVDTASLKKAWGTVKSDQGRCALATAIAVLAQPAPTQPGAPAAAALVVDAGALRAAYAAVRSAHGWGETKTSAGVM